MRKIILLVLVISCSTQAYSQCLKDTVSIFGFSQSNRQLEGYKIYHYDKLNRDIGYEVQLLFSNGDFNRISEKRVKAYSIQLPGDLEVLNDTLFVWDHPSEKLITRNIYQFYFNKNGAKVWESEIESNTQRSKSYNSQGQVQLEIEVYFSQSLREVTRKEYTYGSNNLVEEIKERQIRYSANQTDTLSFYLDQFTYEGLLLKERIRARWNQKINGWEEYSISSFLYNHSRLLSESNTYRILDKQWKLRNNIRYNYDFEGKIVLIDNKEFNIYNNTNGQRSLTKYAYIGKKITQYERKEAYGHNIDSPSFGIKYILTLDGKGTVKDSIRQAWDRNRVDWVNYRKSTFFVYSGNIFLETKAYWNSIGAFWGLFTQEEYECKPIPPQPNIVFRVYPNPVTRMLTLSLLKGETFEIFNSQGQIVKTAITQFDLVELDLVDLPTGYYFIRASGKMKRFTKI